MLDYRRPLRLTRQLWALLAIPILLTGCVATPEDAPMTPPPPPPPMDAGVPDATEPCGGCDEEPFKPEGGELRLERIQDSADDSAQTLAAQAFFFKNQKPSIRPFGETLPLRAELGNRGYACMDRRGGAAFDSGKAAEAQAIADSREYYDVGQTATLTSTDAPSEVITLERFRQSDDPDGAIDLSSGLTHDVLYKGDAARRIRRNTTYRPSIAGSPDYPALDLKWGETADGSELANPLTGEGTPQIYMPSAFVLTSPAEEDFFTPGFLRFTRGQDMVLRYTTEPRPANWPHIMPYASFVDGEGRVQAFCYKFTFGSDADSADGEFIVPYEVLEIAQPDGRLIFGRMVHAAWENTVNGVSRLDLIGMESKRSPPYTIQDALPELR